MTAPMPRREEEDMRVQRNERLYALLRGLRETPEPTSGVRVGILSYNETVVYDAIVGALDEANAEIAHLRARLAAVEAERDEARTIRDHNDMLYRSQWDRAEEAYRTVATLREALSWIRNHVRRACNYSLDGFSVLADKVMDE